MIAANVYLWGTKVGTVAEENVGSLPYFNYDKNFIKSGIEISPFMMPLNSVIYSFPALLNESFLGLPGVFADSLPDKFGNKLIEKYLEEKGRDIKSFSAAERLLYVGKRGMGALTYEPAYDEIDYSDYNINIPGLIDVANKVLSEKEKFSISDKDKNFAKLLSIGTSAGGARAKAIIGWNKKTHEIRSGQIDLPEDFEYYIIKFDGIINNKDKNINPDSLIFTRIEYMYYLMAIDSGINMMDSELFYENGRYHFLTKRFDRKDGGRLHMVSLAGLLHMDFNMRGVYSYEQVATYIKKLGLGMDTILEFYRRMVFNDIMKNYDDHVKNISFLMDKKGVYSLAPAYDITYAYEPKNRWLEAHQMTINGKVRDIVDSDLIESGLNMGINKGKIIEVLDRVYEVKKNMDKYKEKANIVGEIVV